MLKILRDHTQEAYIDAINRSWNSLMSKFRSYSSYNFIDTPELSIMYYPVTIPMFNRVTNTTLNEKNADEKIQETIAFFKQENIPFTWQVNPWDKPKNLNQLLQEASLKPSFSPGMAINLDNLKTPTHPNGFSVEKVPSEKVEEFAWLMGRAYGIPEYFQETLVEIVKTIGVSDDYCHYIGYLDGMPVSTASVLYERGVAGIYNVATMPEARGKGIGSAITAAPLYEAIKLGYEVSILHSSHMGFNVYKRLGYEEICKMNRWEWHPNE